jgi:hypothetical protein
MKGLEKVDGLIDKVLGRWGLGDMELFIDICDKWKDIAGERWGTQARPTLLRDGVLTVEAPHGAATILRYASGELLRALDAEFGEGRVTEVRIKAAGLERAIE